MATTPPAPLGCCGAPLASLKSDGAPSRAFRVPAATGRSVRTCRRNLGHRRGKTRSGVLGSRIGTVRSNDDRTMSFVLLYASLIISVRRDLFMPDLEAAIKSCGAAVQPWFNLGSTSVFRRSAGSCGAVRRRCTTDRPGALASTLRVRVRVRVRRCTTDWAL